MVRRNFYDEESSPTAGAKTTASLPIPGRSFTLLKASTSASSLNVSSSSASSRKAEAHSVHTNQSGGNKFEGSMIAPSSHCGTPPRKKWERSFNSFLKGKNPNLSPTMSSSPGSSINSMLPAEDMSTGTNGSGASQSTTGGGMRGSKKKSSFSIIKGSKRLVSRNLSGKSGGLPSMFSKGGASSGRIQRGHQSMDALDVQLRKGQQIAKNDSTTLARRSLPSTSLLAVVASSATTHTRMHFPSSVAEYTRTGPLNGSGLQKEGDCHGDNRSANTETTVSTTPPTFTSALDEQLRGSTSYNNMNATSTACHSPSFQINPVVTEGEEQPNSASSAPQLTQLHRTRSNSRTHIYSSSSNSNSRTNTPVRQYNHNYHDELDFRNVPEIPTLKGLRIQNKHPSSEFHDVGLNLDDSDNSLVPEPNNGDTNLMSQNNSSHYSFSNTTPTIITDGRITEPPENLDGALETIGGMVTVHTSSSYHLLHKLGQTERTVFPASPETKKAFTKIHNSSTDSESPFLGGNKASNVDLAGMYNSQERPVSSSNLLSKSLPTTTFAKDNIIHSNSSRLLKPIQSADSWARGRRYLIAPAALAACPSSTIQGLSGLCTESVKEAATSTCPSKASGAIELGDAVMTYIGEKYHLSFGKFSSCKLVLRQNYLFEYDLSAPLTNLPRGIAHLQHATAHIHKDFEDGLELHFYASPCAKVDHRVLLIRVKNKDERDHWITCLNKAARLQIEDLWEIDEDHPLGSGRYASIFAARRKNSKTANNSDEEDRCDKERSPIDDGKYNCALKVINKNEFWRMVIKGRERPDTIVRELAVQSTLTAKFGTKQNFLQIQGFFETSDKVVIELELLDGRDLFEYISSKGVLEEGEAGCIIRDILVALDAMNRAGIAHRDIKPANILMTTSNESKYGVSVKICDFGMSTLVGADGFVRGRCGSPGYVAPEIFKAGPGEGYRNKVDVFSAGVTFYLMLCGYEPFYGETEKALIEANKTAELDFPESEWGKISQDVKDLVELMLDKNPTDRLTAKEALEYPWIQGLEKNEKHNTNRCPGGTNDDTNNPRLQGGICALM